MGLAPASVNATLSALRGVARAAWQLGQMTAEDETSAGARDAAVIALLYGAGLRRSEAATLDLAHYDSTAGELKVRGKGDTERLVPLEAGVTAALDDWLLVRGVGAGPLLCPVRKGGRVELHGRIALHNIKESDEAAGRHLRGDIMTPHNYTR